MTTIFSKPKIQGEHSHSGRDWVSSVFQFLFVWLVVLVTVVWTDPGPFSPVFTQQHIHRENHSMPGTEKKNNKQKKPLAPESQFFSPWPAQTIMESRGRLRKCLGMIHRVRFCKDDWWMERSLMEVHWLIIVCRQFNSGDQIMVHSIWDTVNNDHTSLWTKVISNKYVVWLTALVYCKVV